MLYPIRRKVGSPFGWRRVAGRDDLHTGMDFPAPIGEPVSAAAAGIVRRVYEPGELARYGRTVIVQHPATPAPLFTMYAHLSRADVERGQVVAAGEAIAAVGDTAGTREDPDARVRSPHLHFELLTAWPPAGIDRDRIDPAPYLTGEPAAPSVTPKRAAAGLGALLAVVGLAWALNRKRRQRFRSRRPSLSTQLVQDLHPTPRERSWNV